MTNTSDDNNIKIFDVNGNQINIIQRGINIIKMSDGTTKKNCSKIIKQIKLKSAQRWLSSDSHL